MKKLIIILACGVLCPALNDAAQETSAPQQRTTRKKATSKKPAKTTASKKKKNPRSKTTTAGDQKTRKSRSTKKGRKTRSTTTTAGNKKTSSSTRAKKTTKPKSTQPKRVYRKGGVTYRRFNKLDTVTPQAALGSIAKPTTHIISLSEPSRGYKNSDYITFSTQDGKPAQIVLKSHELTAERAKRKGLEKLSHVGQKSVEVFAGNNATGQGLARIGEFALLNANLKGTDDLQIVVEPNGQVTLSGKNAYGTFTPLTEFSIHQ